MNQVKSKPKSYNTVSPRPLTAVPSRSTIGWSQLSKDIQQLSKKIKLLTTIENNKNEHKKGISKTKCTSLNKKSHKKGKNTSANAQFATRKSSDHMRTKTDLSTQYSLKNYASSSNHNTKDHRNCLNLDDSQYGLSQAMQEINTLKQLNELLVKDQNDLKKKLFFADL